MNLIKRTACAVFLLLVMLLHPGIPSPAYSTEANALSASGGGDWAYVEELRVTEHAGLERFDEPVEVVVTSDKVAPHGEDIRITDANGTEVPCQVSAVGATTFKVSFFAEADAYSSSSYHLYYGNPNAAAPSYGSLSCTLDNQAKLWQTGGVYVRWGGKAGYNVSGKNAITVLRLDNDNDQNPANDLDCLTDEYAWDWFYGYLGSGMKGENPGDFGSSQAQVVEDGPVFCEVALGDARLRYYKGNRWLVTNQHADSMLCFDSSYQFMKNGLGSEEFISNSSASGTGQWLVGYHSASENPGYLAFRDPNSGLVFGAVATNVAQWYMHAKRAGAWDRAITFDDSSDRPDAKIYWYSDTSNSYEGIERLSKQVLNPLQVEVITDTDPPVTSASIVPERPDGFNGWYATQPSITLTASEPSTMYYRFDGEPLKRYDGPIGVPEGATKLFYCAEDEAGNREQEKTLQMRVDCGRPEVSMSLFPSRPGNRYLVNEPITFSFDATDSVSGVESVSATLDGTAILSGAQLLCNKLGEHTFTATVRDAAGNQAVKTETFTVGYDFAWLRPVRRPGDPDDQPYVTSGLITIPFRFSAHDALGKFVFDRSVRVMISDGTNAAMFSYGRSGSNVIRINSCDQKYLLDVNPRSYPWLAPGGRYTVSVYFGGDYQYLGMLHGQIGLELQ